MVWLYVCATLYLCVPVQCLLYIHNMYLYKYIHGASRWMVTLYAWKVPLFAHVQQERHPTEDPLLQVSRYNFRCAGCTSQQRSQPMWQPTSHTSRKPSSQSPWSQGFTQFTFRCFLTCGCLHIIQVIWLCLSMFYLLEVEDSPNFPHALFGNIHLPRYHIVAFISPVHFHTSPNGIDITAGISIANVRHIGRAINLDACTGNRRLGFGMCAG